MSAILDEKFLEICYSSIVPRVEKTTLHTSKDIKRVDIIIHILRKKKMRKYKETKRC